MPLHIDTSKFLAVSFLENKLNFTLPDRRKVTITGKFIDQNTFNSGEIIIKGNFEWLTLKCDEFFEITENNVKKL